MTSASTYSDSTQSDDDLIAHVEQSEDPIGLLPERPLPHLDNHYIQHGKAASPDEPLIVVKPEALQRVHEHGVSNLRSELGGFYSATLIKITAVFTLWSKPPYQPIAMIMALSILHSRPILGRTVIVKKRPTIPI